MQGLKDSLISETNIIGVLMLCPDSAHGRKKPSFPCDCVDGTSNRPDSLGTVDVIHDG